MLNVPRFLKDVRMYVMVAILFCLLNPIGYMESRQMVLLHSQLSYLSTLLLLYLTVAGVVGGVVSLLLVVIIVVVAVIKW